MSDKKNENNVKWGFRKPNLQNISQLTMSRLLSTAQSLSEELNNSTDSNANRQESVALLTATVKQIEARVSNVNISLSDDEIRLAKDTVVKSQQVLSKFQWQKADFKQIVDNRLKDTEENLAAAKQALKTYHTNPSEKNATALDDAVRKLKNDYQRTTATFTSQYTKGTTLSPDASRRVGNLAGELETFEADLSKKAPQVHNKFFSPAPTVQQKPTGP